MKKLFYPAFFTFFIFPVMFMLVFLAGAFLFAMPASAHCDTMDGPVVSSARKALETGNPNYALVWVKPENEDKIKKALQKAKAKKIKSKDKDENELADNEFFQALVKIHREGEGARYEGLKAAGAIEPELALADEAVHSGRLDKVLQKITSKHNKEMLKHLFHKVQETAGYDTDDLTAGRKHIEAYVIFIHAVEKAIKGDEVREEEVHEHGHEH